MDRDEENALNNALENITLSNTKNRNNNDIHLTSETSAISKEADRKKEVDDTRKSLKHKGTSGTRSGSNTTSVNLAKGAKNIIGDQLCGLFYNDRDMFKSMAYFLSDRLQEHHQLVLIESSEKRFKIICYYLEKLGMHPHQLIQCRKLKVYKHQEIFKPDKGLGERAVYEGFQKIEILSRMDGYRYIRVCAEPLWLIESAPSRPYFDYQRGVNAFFMKSSSLAFFCHGMNRFSPKLLLDVLHSFPICLINREFYHNFYFIPDDKLKKLQRVDDKSSLMLQSWIENLMDRKRFEKNLRKGKEAAVRRAERNSRFLATMSHEIRTPMNGVVGMTEILLDSTRNMPEEVRRGIEIIRSSGQHLLNIINDILDQSAIDHGVINFEKGSVSIARLLSRVKVLSQGSAAKKNLTIKTITLAGTPELVIGDLTRLTQVLLNLVGNAIKFSKPDGTITIAVNCIGNLVEDTKAPEAPVPSENMDWIQDFKDSSLKAEYRAGSVAPFLEKYDEGKKLIVFFVKDEGIGIPPGKLGSIFESYSQADASTTRLYGGTGLGLSICLKLVELWGGKMNVESIVDQHSTFSFTLPTVSLNELNDDYSGIESGSVVTSNTYSSSTMGNSFSISNTSSMKGSNPEECKTKTALVPNESPNFSTLIHNAEAIRYVSTDAPPEIHSKTEATQSPITPMSLPSREISNDRATSDQFSNIRILIAEDNSVNQLVFSKTFERLGCKYVMVGNGREAIEKASVEERFDVVFMDLHMPVMDGFTATRLLRDLQKEGNVKSIRHAPIIALTASAILSGNEEKLLEYFDSLLIKPVTLRTFEKELDKIQSLRLKRESKGKGKE